MSPDYTTDDVRRRPPAVVVVEALGPSFFANGHIPGAVNLPPHRVRATAPTVVPDTNTPVVVYGTDRGCPQAEMVIRILIALGYRNVSRYRDGKQGWAAAGLPLDSSDSSGS